MTISIDHRALIMPQNNLVIKDEPIQQFTLWHGEMHIMVLRHFGMHGFPDAVLVVRRPDSPMTTYQFNVGYNRQFDDFDWSVGQQTTHRMQLMDLWIHDTIMSLATRQSDGEVCEIFSGNKFLFN